MNYQWRLTGLGSCCVLLVVACGDISPAGSSAASGVGGTSAAMGGEGGGAMTSSGTSSSGSSGTMNETMNGQGGGTTTYSGPPIDLSDFPARLAAAWCGNVEGCCQQPGVTYDASECNSNGVQAIESILAIFDTSNVQYDPVGAGACVARYAALTATCTLEPPGDATLDCPEAFKGTLQPGSPCTYASECLNPNDAFATCATLPPHVDGMPNICLLSGGRGKRGDVCNLTCYTPRDFCLYADGSTNMNMVSPALDPTVCEVEDGLFCQGSTHTCQPAAPLGGACAAHGCVADTYCKNGTCAPGEDTGPCSDRDECSAKAFCNLFDNPSSPECEPLRTDGVACDDASECSAQGCIPASGSGTVGACGPLVVVTAPSCLGHLN